MKDYDKIKELYNTSFPKQEKMSKFLIWLMSFFGILKKTAYYDGNVFSGFVYVIEKKRLLYVLYLAVNNEIRGRGYGSQIINSVIEKYKDKTVFLIEEAKDKNADNLLQREKRISFYEKMEFMKQIVSPKIMALDMR